MLTNVLSEKREMGIDLAIRVAAALNLNLIDFLVGMRILPASATNDSSSLKYILISVFDELDSREQKQLINIAKAMKEADGGG